MQEQTTNELTVKMSKREVGFYAAGLTLLKHEARIKLAETTIQGDFDELVTWLVLHENLAAAFQRVVELTKENSTPEEWAAAERWAAEHPSRSAMGRDCL